MSFRKAFFSKDIAIDLGTANTLVLVRGEGIKINAPSIVAIRRRDRKLLALGKAAQAMIGKTHSDIEIIRPMRHGVIDDDDVAEQMIRAFIKEVHHNSFSRPRVVVCVPSGVNKAEKRVIRNAAEFAGAREVQLIAEPMAAAIGVQLPIGEPVGSMIVDIGGGTTEIAVISLSGIVTQNSIRVAGDAMDEAVKGHIRKNYNLDIGDRTAENIKCAIGTATTLPVGENFVAGGKDLITGMPRTCTVSSDEIREALKETVTQMVNAVRKALEMTPPELAADIRDRGIVLTGGGAKLKGLTRKLRDETGLPVSLADDPLTCVVRGTGRVLENLEANSLLLLNQE